jgi:hypothetical protein
MSVRFGWLIVRWNWFRHISETKIIFTETHSRCFREYFVFANRSLSFKDRWISLFMINSFWFEVDFEPPDVVLFNWTLEKISLKDSSFIHSFIHWFIHSKGQNFHKSERWKENICFHLLKRYDIIVQVSIESMNENDYLSENVKMLKC